MSPGEVRQFIGNYTITGTVAEIKSGEYLTYRVEVNYSFSANATLDVEVISKEAWEEMRRAGKLVYRDVQAKYTGGPVELGLGVGTQPIRDDIGDLPITISLRNIWTGKVGKLEYAEIKWDPNFTKGEKTSCNLTELTSLATGKIVSEKHLIDYCMVFVEEIEAWTKTYYVNAYVNYIYTQSAKETIGVWYVRQCTQKKKCIEGKFRYCNENYEIVCHPDCCPSCPVNQRPFCQANGECGCILKH
jgi:hypothetical protein